MVIIFLLLVAGGLVFLFYRPIPAGAPKSVSRMEIFESDHIGLRLSYPDHYSLTTRHDGYKDTEIHVLVLIDKELASSTFDASEGPPTISILEIPLENNVGLETWIKDNSISNFYLSADKKLDAVTLGGESALQYTYSGLYENDAVAVIHNDKVFLFFASWLTQNDQLRKDFQSILNTVTFI